MSEPPAPRRRRRRERWIAVAAVAALVPIWIVGGRLRRGDVEGALAEAWPDAQRFEALDARLFEAVEGERRIGYVALAEASGYGGPLTVAAAVDPDGTLVGIGIADHKETPAFLDKVTRSGLPEQLAGRAVTDPLRLGHELDAVTGATYTAEAFVDATVEAGRSVAANQLGLAVPARPPAAIRVGAAEIALLLLYVAWFVGTRRAFPWRKPLRWATLLIGAAALGWWLNVPLTLARITLLLQGTWPPWQTNVYWYLLVGGLLLVATARGRNAYCSWFCPFGAVQEGLGALGGARRAGPRGLRRRFVWVQRGLAWAAVALALLLRNPGLTSYEVFGTVFALTGSVTLFALAGLTLALSLFVKRPWCTYLCPMDPIYALIRGTRSWIKESWTSRDRARTA